MKLLSIDIYMSVYTLGVVFFLFSLFKSFKEEFEDTKGVIRIVYRRRTDNTMAKRKSTKGQTCFFLTYLLFITMSTKYLTKYM